jgi:signal transduction histidine kinase
MEILDHVFHRDFMPHGHCYFWEPAIVWSHAIADSIIALAYFTIPMSLFFIFRKRTDFNYVWIALCFAVFILGCGATHVMDVINIWEPMYRLDAGLRILTAVASIGTAIILIKITPQVLLIPSIAEWKRVNNELTESHSKLKDSYDELSKAEDLLRKSNVDLEEKVEARTKELELKNEELKKINYDLDSFVYVASHDLKAPISNLVALINLAKEEAGKEDHSDLIDLLSHIDNSVGKFDQTIHYLSDITRIYKNINDEIDEIHFDKILTEIKTALSEHIKISGVQIQTDFQIPSIRFSYTDLRSLFENLLTNAIKYRSTKDIPTIHISTYQEDDAIVVKVKDNGIGFDMNKKEKIFEMFRRLHDHVEGSGVGLYMVKRIVDNTKGKIEVDSKINEGTIFKIYLRNQS